MNINPTAVPLMHKNSRFPAHPLVRCRYEKSQGIPIVPSEFHLRLTSNRYSSSGRERTQWTLGSGWKGDTKRESAT
jgi:hypothetical protein